MARPLNQVLAITSQIALQHLIIAALEKEGISVTCAANETEALRYSQPQHLRLILLDLSQVTFSNPNPLQAVKQLRQLVKVPIIALGTDTRLAKVVDATQGQIDEYLTLPLDLEELIILAQTILRRGYLPALPALEARTKALKFGKVEIDLAQHQFRREGKVLALSRTDWAMLELFISHAGRLLSSRLILKRVWGSAYEEESNYIRIYTWRLRRKLEDDPKRPQYLLTDPGQGYYLNLPALTPTFDSTPAILAASKPATNLPERRVPLVGRKHDLQAVLSLLKRPEVRLVTLTGAGGAGKTSLGLQVVAELQGQFEQGVFFVALAAIHQPEMVPAAIARIWQLEAYGEQSLLESLKEYLRARQMLLLIDNFEQVIEAAPVIAELLAVAPGLKILTTSRERLHLSDEHEYQVAPLALPDLARLMNPEAVNQSPAVILFIERARKAKPTFRLSSEKSLVIAQICIQLDGLPLAIELAAAWVKLFSPQTILLRLSHSLNLLTGGPRDLPTRQQTLRGAIGWSYDLLTPPEQILFRRLGLFTSRFSLEAVEAICGTPESTSVIAVPIMDQLATLVAKCLVQPVQQPSREETQFVLLETIREYALEQLIAHNEEATLRQRHADYYLALAKQLHADFMTSNVGSAIQRLQAEYDNLRSAIQWLLEQKQGAQVVQVCEEIWPFLWYYGQPSVNRYWLETVRAQAHELPPLTLARALTLLGGAQAESGDYVQAKLTLEESLQALRTLGEPLDLARVTHHLGAVVLEQCDYPRAESLLQESLALQRQLGQPLEVATNLSELGTLALRQGDPTQARALFTESLEVWRLCNDQLGIAHGLTSLGWVERYEGHFDEALQLFESGLAIHQENVSKSSLADSWSDIGLTYLLQNNVEKAFEYFKASLSLGREKGDIARVMWDLERMAEVAQAQGHALKAGRLGGATTRLREKLGTPQPPDEQARHAQSANEARAQLGAPAWEAALAEGRLFSIDHAVDYAIGTI